MDEANKILIDAQTDADDYEASQAGDTRINSTNDQTQLKEQEQKEVRNEWSNTEGLENRLLRLLPKISGRRGGEIRDHPLR